MEPSKGMIAVAESKICAEIEKESSVIESKSFFIVFFSFSSSGYNFDVAVCKKMLFQ